MSWKDIWGVFLWLFLIFQWGNTAVIQHAVYLYILPHGYKHLWPEISLNIKYNWWFTNPVVLSELPADINSDEDSAGISIDKTRPPSGRNIRGSCGVKLWSYAGQDGPLSVCGSLCVWSRWLIAATVSCCSVAAELLITSISLFFLPAH